jgi:hypothetical protein
MSISRSAERRSRVSAVWGLTARLMPALHAALHDGIRDALATVAQAPEGFWGNWYLVGYPSARTWPSTREEEK